ncbi:MAG: 50S ribosomal protein L23 [Proteobacteria bacterium]|nr:50S ribosomal protein L23 [Pseudomonadota bacterium]NOG60251.1 50S ribosomal protein L23 [Pseudomonadota bacterium]
MNQEKLMTVLLEPRVTEKSTMVGETHNQYVFKVAKSATKPEIKKAVELMFDGAEVESVQVANVKGKSKIFARRQGQRVNWKKAYVKLKAGFDIDFMGA